MQHCSTDDLLLYLYGELSADKEAYIEGLLEKSWPLREKLFVLQESVEQLNTLAYQSPRRQSVEAILHYAQERTPVAG